MSLVIRYTIFYGSRVVLFFLLLHLRKSLRTGRIIRFLLLLTLTLTFVWTRRVEPQMITVKHTTVDLGAGKTVALISDLHLGVYKDQDYLRRVVDQINQLTGVDMVMIAGDWTFHAEPDDLEDIFRPLSYLHVPVYGVLGNHDVEHPGPKIRNQLVPVLEEYGVIMLQNDVLDFGDRKLVGLGDYTGREDEVSLLRQFHVLDTVVVLTHNPDTTLAYDGYGADLTLVGHTHCGQIRLPFLRKYIAPFIIPVQGPFDCGVTQTKYTQIVITPWLGEVVLPMRRFNPPTIDIVHF